MLRPLLLSGLLLLTGAACAKDGQNSESVGDLRVIVNTTGAHPDTNGYTLTVTGIGSQNVAINDTSFFNDLPIDDYGVNLTGTTINCTVAGGAFKTPYVSVGITTTTFDVTCP